MEIILKDMEERWNAHALNYDARHDGKLSEKEVANWKHCLQTHIGKDNGQKIIDVGAGSGFLTLKIAALGYDCRGLDMSNGMMDIGRKHAAQAGLKVEFIKGDLADLPFPDESMDVVTNRRVLWTLLEPGKAFKEWRRVLKPGGKLFCFCTIGKKGMPCNHYSQEIENMLELKDAPVSKLCRCLEDAGFGAVQAVLLDDLGPGHGNSFWYVIKGRKEAG